MFGSMPSQELMNRKPEDLSFQSALHAWNVGFGDGAGSATHALFDGDGAEGLQMFYDDGYERGERERSVVDRMNTRHGSGESSGEPAENPRSEASTADTPVENTGDPVGSPRAEPSSEEVRAGEASIDPEVIEHQEWDARAARCSEELAGWKEFLSGIIIVISPVTSLNLARKLRIAAAYRMWSGGEAL